ncbi:MAG: hypothetical protein QOH46_2919, partial [Solirubrobacteraceae bacterium]|nr:hypothetical protein [Solirubrobacteraceae bacterium]
VLGAAGGATVGICEGGARLSVAGELAGGDS